MKNIFVKPSKDLTLIGGAASFATSLVFTAFLVLLFVIVRNAFDAVPLWVHVAMVTLLGGGIITSSRLKIWGWVKPASIGWAMASFAYFLSAHTHPDPEALWDFSKLGVVLLTASMLLGSAASIVMPIALRLVDDGPKPGPDHS